MNIFENPGIRFKIEKFPKPEPNPKFISLKPFIFDYNAIMTVNYNTNVSYNNRNLIR